MLWYAIPKQKAECKKALRRKYLGLTNCYAADDLLRAFALRFVLFSRLAVNSAETAFWSFSVSTR